MRIVDRTHVYPLAGYALALWAAGLSMATLVQARPEAPGVFCETYPEAAACLGRVVECRQCHDSTYPPAWNSFGTALFGTLPREVTFAEGLPVALAAIEGMDSDADGVANLEEIRGGTYPGDPSSFWIAPAVPDLPENPRYDIGAYDLAFALRRASILYCGRSPTYAEVETFRAPDADPKALRAELHSRVQACLEAPYWQEEALKRLADDRIRPARTAGAESEVFLGPVRLVIGDYEYDYRLWVYALTGDRDARDLLLAQYHVVKGEDGSWQREEGTISKPDPEALAGGQLLPPERRAGMLTTQWFLARNTMFSELPRTSAAAAYRAYLGADISKTQGLVPVANEPDDIDNKNVDEARCASCHSTLDPLAYAFARYEGIPSIGYEAASVFLSGGELPFGAYDEGRPARLIPGWSDEDQQAVILGQEVQSLREWAQVAADSDAFARNLAQMFFEHALSRGPNPAEMAEFTDLWQRLPEDGFSANALIHRLIDTQAFGAP